MPLRVAFRDDARPTSIPQKYTLNSDGLRSERCATFRSHRELESPRSELENDAVRLNTAPAPNKKSGKGHSYRPLFLRK